MAQFRRDVKLAGKRGNDLSRLYADYPKMLKYLDTLCGL
jgi:hypothetical protein